MIETIDIGIILCKECTEIGCECNYHRGKQEEVIKLLRGLSSSGFIQVVNHDVDENVIRKAIESSRLFFCKELELKLRYESKDKARRGYSPMMAENFGSLAGDSGKPNDSVEKYRIGPSVSVDQKSMWSDYYNHKEARVHFFENDWQDLSEDFVNNIKSYYDSMTKLCGVLLCIIESAMDLSNGFFHPLVDKHTSILSLNYYPPLCTSSLRNCGSSVVTRVAEHTDVSMLTVVHQSVSFNEVDIGGLEVFDQTCGEWLKVPYTPNAFVVNVGDCLSDWSRGLFKSSMHRVVMQESPDKLLDRCSLAYFFAPNYDAELVWPNSEGQSKDSDKPINYTTWRKNRIKRAMQMLKNK